YIVEHIYQSDPDRPDKLGTLSRPGVDIADGDAMLSIHGTELGTADPGELLRNQAGKQVLLRVRPKGKTETRDVIVNPISMQDEAGRRYHEWEFTRRLKVEQAGAGQLGYLHLRALGSNDINQWEEEYYPV